PGGQLTCRQLLAVPRARAGHPGCAGALGRRGCVLPALPHADTHRAGHRGGTMNAPAGNVDGPVGGAGRLLELRQDDPAWLDLVGAAPGATVFHLPAWTRVVTDTYGYRAAAFDVQEDGGRVGVGVQDVHARWRGWHERG